MSATLRFLGAAQNVTGSRFLLEANGTTVLIDCGLYQERNLRNRNWDPFPVPPEKIDAVLLTHAHLDHCGWFPKLHRDGFRGKLYCTEATARIAQIVMEDSGHIQESDAAYKRKRHQRAGHKPKRPVEPLYTAADARAAVECFSPITYDETVTLGNGVEASFHHAGHILGAASIRVTVSTGSKQTVIVFSGDLGRWDAPILKDPVPFEGADYILVESTYGDRTHADNSGIGDALAEVINATAKAGGNVIIPTFALERAQDVLYYLNELYLKDRIPSLLTFLDSPMAIKVTDVFEDYPELFDDEMSRRVNRHHSPFDLPGLTMTHATDSSKAINKVRGSVIVLAGSGMCTGGRVKHHLEHNISRAESTILFVGYQAIGTLGRQILEGAKHVRIHGVKRTVRARIERINGFSGHADRDELLRWLSGLKQPPKKAFVIHGEPKSAQRFGDLLRTKMGWEVSVPNYDHIATLD